MDRLPDEMIRHLLLQMSPLDILNYCRVDHNVARICQGDLLWLMLLERDFPNAGPGPEITLKDYYFLLLLKKDFPWAVPARPYFPYQDYYLFFAIHGRIVPRNYEEALYSMALISPQRSGKASYTFSINELKQLATNLGVSPAGSKDDLAYRIRRSITFHFGVDL